MTTFIGRRVATIGEITQPGDYCGPIRGYTGPKEDDPEACFFRLPPASTPDADDLTAAARAAMRHVAFPPHTYRECPDGSLEIRASIGAYGYGPIDSGRGFIWHGYLDCGHVWREV